MHIPDVIDNDADIIDSRDVIARIDHLVSMREAEQENGGDLDEDDRNELRTLIALDREGEQLSDWHHGETLVRESYFVTYAEQLADDIGAINADVQWPLTHIDWDAAASDLRQDYTEIDFGGVTYLARA